MSSIHLRAKDVFLAALDRPAADRGAFVADTCGEDAALRHEVESLLEFHDDEDEVETAPGPSRMSSPRARCSPAAIG
jgi:hypothetical protein